MKEGKEERGRMTHGTNEVRSSWRGRMRVKIRGSISYTEETDVGGGKPARHPGCHLLARCSKGFFPSSSSSSSSWSSRKQWLCRKNKQRGLREKWKMILIALPEWFMYRTVRHDAGTTFTTTPTPVDQPIVTVHNTHWLSSSAFLVVAVNPLRGAELIYLVRSLMLKVHLCRMWCSDSKTWSSACVKSYSPSIPAILSMNSNFVWLSVQRSPVACVAFASVRSSERQRRRSIGVYLPLCDLGLGSACRFDSWPSHSCSSITCTSIDYYQSRAQ